MVQRATEGGPYSQAELDAVHELPAGNAPLSRDPKVITEIVDSERLI